MHRLHARWYDSPPAPAPGSHPLSCTGKAKQDPLLIVAKMCVWQGVGTAEMNAGDEPVIGITSTYQEPGTYTLEVG